MSGNRSHNDDRPSLNDIPAFAGSSFARSLLDGGDYSHLLYDDQNDTVTTPRRHSSLSAQQFHSAPNPRLDNRQTTSDRSLQRPNNYRSQNRLPINPSEQRRQSIAYNRDRGDHPSERPSWNTRNPPLETPKPHEGLAPSPLSCLDQPKSSKKRQRLPECLKVGNSLPPPSDGFELDHRIQKIKICKQCGEPLSVSKFQSLVRCHKCEMVMHNNSSPDAP